MQRFGTVLVTGASSGLGAAPARACAGPGVVLHLCGRGAGRLAATAEMGIGRVVTLRVPP